jgi:Flp pilus assembly pilin Flp
MSLRNLRQTAVAFHDDEEGLEAVQTIMIVAIAAVLLIAVMTVGQQIFTWLKTKWSDLQGKDIS